MRPLKLTMCAFGPYAQEQVIDFERLGERSLFLIHGPTGSGKSSILDAICYVLYDETSGGKEESQKIRSHHAPEHTLTRVQLTFRKNDQRYRISRSPEQQRPKKKGTGSTRQARKAQLEKWDREKQDWRLVSKSTKEVAQQVEQVLGFRVAQFRQVMVLPQGRIRKLLSAGTEERSKILSTLFQTQEYKEIQEALKDEARKLSDGLHDLEQEVSLILEEEGLSTPGELEQLAKHLRSQKTQLDKKLNQLSKRDEELTRKRDGARELARAFAERDAAQKDLTDLGARADRVAQDKTSRDQAKKAAELNDLDQQLSQQQKSLADVDQRLAQCQKDLAGAAEIQEQVRSDFERAESAQPERDVARTEKERLAKLAAQSQDLKELEQSLARAHKAEEQLRQDLRTFEDHLEELTQDMDGQREELIALEKLAARLESLQAEQKRLARRQESLDQVEQLQEELSQNEKILIQAQERVRELEEQHKALRREQTEKQQALLEGQAGLLAQNLEQGQACPVCGSLDHPAKADPGPHLPDPDQLSALEENLKQGELDLARERQKLSQISSKLAELGAQLKEHNKQDGEHELLKPAEMKQQALRCETELSKSRGAQSKVSRQTKKLKQLKTELTGGQKSLKGHRQKHEKALALNATLTAQLNERLRELPQDLRQSGALTKASQEARERSQKLQAAWEDIRRAREKADQRASNLQTRLEQLEQEQNKSRAAKDATQAQLDNRISRSGFGDRQTWLSCKLDQAELDSLDQAIRQYEESLAAAQDRLIRAQAEVEGQTVPDLTGPEQELSELRTLLESTREERGGQSQRLVGLEHKLAQIKDKHSGMDSLEKDHSLVGELSHVANHKDMSFERYVLSAMLDEVLRAASVRLWDMSRQRYQLRRELGSRDGRRNSGLDLVVFDAHTGQERAVQSLSGGEGFLAALALTLALADVVQAHAGGIRLDTIFIDEGFGSLDPESLEQAFATLMQINASGRLVGIISHVPELAERIDARLEIRPSTRGSVAKFVL